VIGEKRHLRHVKERRPELDEEPGQMNARDVMTTPVVSVLPDESTREIARLLIDKGISAVPVVDNNGAPIGMVTEGDLIRRDEAREARREWWLELLAEGERIAPELLAWLDTQNHTARVIMSTPVITVSEETQLRDIARLLVAHRIKRVPVVRDNRVVGIVARGDLLRALLSGDADMNFEKL
jgi:CBS domain-containing protein